MLRTYLKNQFRFDQTKIPFIFYRLYTFRSLANYFHRKKYPLTSRSFKHKPIFVLGSGRSGSTLLRRMLMASNKIAIPPESYVIGVAYRIFRLYNHLDWERLVRMVLNEFKEDKHFHIWELNLEPVYQKCMDLSPDERSLQNIIHELFSYYRQTYFPQAGIWGDKTPRNAVFIDWIYHIFPNAKYIHIVRDGRDVAASLLQNHLAPNLTEAIRKWDKSIRNIHKLAKKHPQQFLELRYEDLVSKTEPTLKSICDFIEIPFQNDLINSEKIFEILQDSHHFEYHQKVGTQVSTDRIGKWKDFFDEKSQKLLNRKMRKKLEIYQYDI